MKSKIENKVKANDKDNVMRNARMTKMVISAGAVGPELDKAVKLLGIITGTKAQIIKSGPKRRIPAFNVKPDMPLGTRITLRGNKAKETLMRLLAGVGNRLRRSQVVENHFSFGIKEYIDVPSLEYNRDIGIRGFNVTVVFERAGVRVIKKKIKRGKLPRRHHVSPEEIIKFMEENFKTKFV
ncbi:hypothetical protein AUJ84_03135 [Candidatus Pacearchaeota archaeon CG1_02_32_132]|nr:MAG: hypothetical protein AUJ84_03135 [Candidatus Pacearchaeota archaeon CG1_02_32_132]